MCTTIPWRVRATLIGALSSPSITSWLRKRLSSLRRSPCSPGMRPNTRFLLAWRCRSGTPTTSQLMTSWVRNDKECQYDFWTLCPHSFYKSLLSSSTPRRNWIRPESVPSWCQDGQAMFPRHDPKRAGAAHYFHLQTKEGQGLVAICFQRWEWWYRTHGEQDMILGKIQQSIKLSFRNPRINVYKIIFHQGKCIQQGWNVKMET